MKVPPKFFFRDDEGDTDAWPGDLMYYSKAASEPEYEFVYDSAMGEPDWLTIEYQEEYCKTCRAYRHGGR